MKQTNNAIKFLMAQYRAIFKNANLKMFLAAATAAAAMAAGSAQAGSFDNAALGKQADLQVAVDGTTFDSITLTDGAADAGKAFEITVSSGGDTNKLKGGIDLSASSITIAGNDKDQAKLTIEKGGKPTSLKVNALTVSDKGTLVVSGSDADNKTVVTANTLTFGKADGGKAADVVVTIDQFSDVTGENLEINNATVTVKSDAVLKGSTVAINKGASVTLSGGALYGNETTINDGTVALDGGTLGNAANTLTMKSGSATVAAGKTGTIAGSKIVLENGTISNEGTLNIGADTSTITLTAGTVESKNDAAKTTFTGTTNFEGAKLDVQSGTVTFAGETHFNKGEVSTSGTIVLNGNTTIADGVFKTVDAKSKLQIGNAKLELSAAALKGLGTGKVEASGAQATDVSEIRFTDETAFNLGTGSTATDLALIKDDGTLDDKKVANSGNGILKLSGKEASYKGDKVNAAITLGFDKMTLGKTNFTISGGAGVEVVEGLTIGTGSGDLTVSNGNLTLNGASGSVAAKTIILTAGSSASDASFDVMQGKWSVPALTITKGEATVEGGATLDVAGALTVTEGSANVIDKARLNITGDLTTVNNNGTIDVNAGTVNTFGSTGGVVLKSGTVSLENTAVLNLDAEDIFTSGTVTLDKTKFEENAVEGEANTTIAIQKDGKKLSLTKDEFTALKTAAGTSFKGLFDLDVTGISVSGDEIALKDVVGNVQTDAYNNITATTDGAAGVDGVYSVGNIKVTADKDLVLATGGALTLNHANADGHFVAKSGASGNVLAGVSMTGTDNSLTLGGTGDIGAISTTTQNSGALTIGSSSATGVVTVKGDIGASGTELGSVTVNGASDLVVSGSVYVADLDMRENSSLDVGAGSVAASSATIKGDVTAGTLTLSGTANDSFLIAGDADVNVGTMVVGGSGVLTVGMDGESGSTANVFSQFLDIQNGSKLFVDPDFSKPAAFVVTQDLKDTTGTDVGVLKGNIFVGKNAAFGYGFDEAEFKDLMSNYLNGHGAFDENGIMQNALVVNKPLSIASGHSIEVNPALTQDLVAKATATDTLKLASGGGLILTDAALSDPTKAAITFGTNATVDAASGSVVSLFGEFTAKDTNLKFFAATGGNVTLTNDIKVEALGGMLEGTLSKTASTVGTLDKLALSDKAKDIAYNGVSTPVGDLFMAVAAGDFVGSAGLGYDFVTGSMSNKQFKAVDAAAHAATYAGAQQAAVASVGTMAEAVGGRVGSMGVEAASIAATGSQAQGGVWVTPMYKSVDADGFGAQGTTYGADVDLAGVAFGTDTVNGNMRFGAVFNIGSGDSDGKGQGSGLKDEFDYYGIGIYSAMGFGSFALVGDASLNVISHDVEGLGLKGEADTTAVTMGVTGQYTISNPMVDVTPHLGARFIRLDTDSYDLTSADGVLATTDFEVQNVFSVPLGVTLSKAFEMGGWSLAPSADLTITFNAGDTEAESTTRFAGINRNIGLTTEVLDEVTYGVAVGLGAQYGAFGTSFNVNYTGSENTDALGVNAQARYMF